MTPAPATLAQDQLLAELNGDAPLPPLVDAAPAQAPSRDVELEAKVAPKPTPIQAANAAAVNGHRVTVEGEFLATSPLGKGRIKKSYEESFNLPDLTAALSVIKNKLLAPRLQKKHPDFARVYTLRTKDVQPLSPSTPPSNNIAYMTRAQLEAEVKARKAPIDLAAYPQVPDLRDALVDFVQNPSGFEAREAERQTQRAEDRALAAMNPEDQP